MMPAWLCVDIKRGMTASSGIMGCHVTKNVKAKCFSVTPELFWLK